VGLFSENKPLKVQIQSKPLRCHICGCDVLWHREAPLNTAVATFFNFDCANASATCYVCDGYGYIHWFLPRR